jgi:nucleotidyltransferase/DNA polymerase involved in DNA repair
MVYKTPVRHVTYLAAPAFGATLARRAEPALASRPLVLLDDQGRVLTGDAAAGVKPGQTESQAVARCPVAAVRPAARYPILETQALFLERVARYAGRWQPAGLGRVYLDTTGIGGDLLSWCQSLVNEVRRFDIAPAVGMANNKFSATAAGQAAGRDTMLLLTPRVQSEFLASQPTHLLPLDTDALLHLQHLGIRTLGQYAQLPTTGVLARFGEAGRTAQRWARGHDERSVIPPEELPEASGRIEFEAPVANRDILLAALARQATLLLAPLNARLQAVGKIRLAILRSDRRIVSVGHTFPLPTAAFQTIRLALGSALEQAPWDGEAAADIILTLADITDAPVHQLSLLDTPPTPREVLAATLERLAARFGPDTFRMAVLSDPTHPLPERRANWKEFG